MAWLEQRGQPVDDRLYLLRDAEWNQGNFALSAIFWTSRLFTALRPYRVTLQKTIPGFLSISVGFFDARREFEQDGFGLIVNRSSDFSWRRKWPPSDFLTGRPDWPYPTTLGALLEVLGNDRDTAAKRDPARERLLEFPVVFRQVQESLHACADPLRGVMTSYAVSQKSSAAPVRGVLIAKHVLDGGSTNGAVIGSMARLKDGMVLRVGDVAPAMVDAAVLEVSLPNGMQLRPMQPWVAQYMPATILTPGGPIHTRVNAVTDTRDIWNDLDSPAYVELDHAGAPGDSGSLVVDPAGNALGLYRGVVTLSGGTRIGRAAHLRQITAVMDMELYS